jgi:hypothetical protein
MKSKPFQIGIILCNDIAKQAVPALKFLILQLNTLQSAFEYQLLPNTLDPLLVKLASGEVLQRAEIERDLVRFARDYRAYLKRVTKIWDLSSAQPSEYILISRAMLADRFYMTGEDNVSIIALGHWDRLMAPPSLVESILSLVLSSSFYAIPALSSVSHFGTKGCLFDFNTDLSNARFMTLQGFICSECRQQLEDAGYPKLVHDLGNILAKKWLGQVSDPTSPAGIAAKLGYDLFATKGLTPSWPEKFWSALKEDGVKEMTKVVVGALVALLLGFLGIKEITRSSNPASTQTSTSPAPLQVPKVSPTASPNE